MRVHDFRASPPARCTGSSRANRTDLSELIFHTAVEDLDGWVASVGVQVRKIICSISVLK